MSGFNLPDNCSPQDIDDYYGNDRLVCAGCGQTVRDEDDLIKDCLCRDCLGDDLIEE